LVVLALLALVPTHEAAGDPGLPVIGPAPPFTLTSQDGAVVSLGSLQGKVVALTFIYTGCPDICPLLTQKMGRRAGCAGGEVRHQDRLCFDHP
jgi:protein SCO1